MITSGTAWVRPGQRGVADAEPFREVGLEERDLALDDADAECGGHGDAEGREAPDQRGGERRDHGQGQHRGVEGDDRGEEDRREGRQRPGDREVHLLDAVR